MLEIIDNLAPFLEDCYRRISVREYAKLIKKSPPTASKLLKSLHTQGFLHKQEERRHLLFYANYESRDFIDLSRIYWRKKLEALCEAIAKEVAQPTIVLFGSAAKAEVKPDSDIDLAVVSQKKPTIITSPYEKELGRKITLYWFPSLKAVQNANLFNNILNGYVLVGRLRQE